MRLLKVLQYMFLSYLIYLLTTANFLNLAREELVTTLVHDAEPKVFSPREDLLPSSWQGIMVQCGEDEIIIQVHRDFLQTGHFIQAKDLSIGPQACHYSIINESATLIILKVELHECIQNLKVLDFMLYVSLYYKPDSASNLTPVKSAEEFPIACHYSWKNKRSSNAIQTTWVPFASAMFEKRKQYFSLRLMTDDWQAEKNSTVYLLGDNLHVQADIRKGNHLPLRLYIDTCKATSKADEDSESQYNIIDFHGCLIKRNSHDQGPSFIIPRTQLETLQFIIPTSQIAGDENSMIYIACHLKITAAAQEPDFLNKACSFNREREIWLPVEGSIEICNCCETGDCGSPAKHKSSDTGSLHMSRQRKETGSRRNYGVVDLSKEEMEGDFVVGPVLIQKAAGNHERDQVGIEKEMVAEGQQTNEVLAMGSNDESYEAYSGSGNLNIEMSPVDVIMLSPQDEELSMESDDKSNEIHSDSADLNTEISPVEVTTMTPQGNAPVKETILGQILTTATGILFFFLV